MALARRPHPDRRGGIVENRHSYDFTWVAVIRFRGKKALVQGAIAIAVVLPGPVIALAHGNVVAALIAPQGRIRIGGIGHPPFFETGKGNGRILIDTGGIDLRLAVRANDADCRLHHVRNRMFARNAREIEIGVGGGKIPDRNSHLVLAIAVLVGPGGGPCIRFGVEPNGAAFGGELGGEIEIHLGGQAAFPVGVGVVDFGKMARYDCRIENQGGEPAATARSGGHGAGLVAVHQFGSGGGPGVQDVDGPGRFEHDDGRRGDRAGGIDDDPHLLLPLEIRDREARPLGGSQAGFAQLPFVVLARGRGPIAGKKKSCWYMLFRPGDRQRIVVLAVDFESQIPVLDIERIEVVRLHVQVDGFAVKAVRRLRHGGNGNQENDGQEGEQESGFLSAWSTVSGKKEPWV